LGVERAVILPGVNPECAFVPQSNEEVLGIAGEHGGRFIPFCNVDPRAMTNSPDAPLGDLLSYYRERGCPGVGEVCANLPFLDPLVQNLFEHVQASGMVLTFHIAPRIGRAYGLFDEIGLPQLERCLQKFPGLRFLGHSQPFWSEIGKLHSPADRNTYPKYGVEEGVVPVLMRRYPNLYGDLSAMSGYNALARDLEYAAGFLEEFQDRLLFGTDICAPETGTPLAGLLVDLRESGAIGDSVFKKVTRENAIDLLGIEGV
jgi:predicted TIM-barrel fold metal-dependent hydrolase